MVRGRILTVIILFIAALLAACAALPTQVQPTAAPVTEATPPPATEAPEVESVLNFAASRDMTTLDVQLTTSAQDEYAGQWMYCRLVWHDKTVTEPIPQIAESWTVSDDGLTFVFDLREGVKFHNGRELTAEDVVFSWDRIFELADISRGDEQLADVESYEATGEYEFTVTLERPNPIFLAGLGHWALAIVPEEHADELETDPVSCGPYTFEEWIPEDHATFIKFDDYWDEEMLARLPDRIVYRPVPEEQARLNMLQTGQVDVAAEIPPQSWELVENAPDLHLVTQEFSSSYLVYIFQTEAPPTSDEQLREAITYAIDREAVVQTALLGNGQIDCNFIPQGHWAYTEFDCPTYDPERARELLNEAGYGEGLELNIVTYDHPIYIPAAEVLQQNLLDIGIDADISVVERGVWLDDAWRGGNFDITIAALTREPDPDGLMSSVFREGGGNNSARYSDPEVERLFDMGKATSDRDERKEIYRQIVEILLDDVPATKVASVFRAAAANDRVQGLYVEPTGKLGWRLLVFNP